MLMYIENDIRGIETQRDPMAKLIAKVLAELNKSVQKLTKDLAAIQKDVADLKKKVK